MKALITFFAQPRYSYYDTFAFGVIGVLFYHGHVKTALLAFVLLLVVAVVLEDLYQSLKDYE